MQHLSKEEIMAAVKSMNGKDKQEMNNTEDNTYENSCPMQTKQ
jgi:hypothetical protein